MPEEAPVTSATFEGKGIFGFGGLVLLRYERLCYSDILEKIVDEVAGGAFHIGIGMG